MENGVLTLHTTLAPEVLGEKLRLWEPWAIRVDFSNGVSTKDFKRRTPFDEQPLIKFSVVEAAIPFTEISGGKNARCRLQRRLQLYPRGEEIRPLLHRHRCRACDISKSRVFSQKLPALMPDLFIASAETFSRPEKFDVAFHFGTLYHLPNPVLSLRTTFDNLRPGGYLALETQVYDHPEDANICYFMHMQNNDPTNFWALSSSVLTKCLELVGFRDMRELLRVVPTEGLTEHMARTILVARKPERLSVRPYALQHVNERATCLNRAEPCFVLGTSAKIDHSFRGFSPGGKRGLVFCPDV